MSLVRLTVKSSKYVHPGDTRVPPWSLLGVVCDAKKKSSRKEKGERLKTFHVRNKPFGNNL